LSHAQSTAEAHPVGLAHHFESLEQQKASAFFGMWLFLVQEVLFFGGLFVTYVYYRVQYPEAFSAGSLELDARIGALNTVVLLLSSFTMVMAVHGAQQGNIKRLTRGLQGTIFFGLLFLGIKWFFEYSVKFEHGLLPGPHFEWHGVTGGEQVEIFFSLYFAMTGMHALHMIVGIGILCVMIPLAKRGLWTPGNHNFVEGFGLYWHFVDIVWIFLFPFLYLVAV